jgi:hypothetical protein
MLAPKASLAAAELAFFSPAFLFGVFLLIRHGFSRQLGWFYVVTLSILRIIGASVTIYMDVNHTYTASLEETVFITSAVGTAPLLLALMGFLERINLGMDRKGLPLIVFRPLHLAALAGLVIAIVGGVDEQHTDASDYHTGRALIKAAAIIFLAIYIGLALITLYTGMNKTYILSNEWNLMRGCILALPFMLVRIIYTICAAFSSKGSIFFFADVNVYVSAFMQFLMEAIVVSIFVVAGMLTPRAPKRQHLDSVVDVEGGNKGVEMEGRPTQHGGYAAPREQRPHRQQRQQRPARQLGDYRPSRLIRDAVRGDL